MISSTCRRIDSALTPKRAGGGTFAVVQETEQDVLSADVSVAQPPGFVLGSGQGEPGLAGQPEATPRYVDPRPPRTLRSDDDAVIGLPGDHDGLIAGADPIPHASHIAKLRRCLQGRIRYEIATACSVR